MDETRTSPAAAQITFRDGATGQEVTCTGKAGENLLQLALAAGLSIEHTCGGVGACSTCHVKVKRGGTLLSAANDNELDRLDEAPDVGFDSRLACQAKITGTGQILVEIPKWNRNAVKEREHG